MEDLAIPLAAIVVALGTLVTTQLSLRQRAKNSYVETLDRRVDRSDEALREANANLERAREREGDLLVERNQLLGQLVEIQGDLRTCQLELAEARRR